MQSLLPPTLAPTPCCSIIINMRGQTRPRTVRKSALNVAHGGSPEKLLTALRLALALATGQGPRPMPVSASLCHHGRGHNSRSVENQSKCDCKLWKWQSGWARPGQAGTLVLGSTCSRGQFDRQQAKCQCPAWPARPGGLACGTFPPLSLLDYTLCLVCLEVFPCYAHSGRLLLCPSVCVYVWGGWNFHGGNRKRNGSIREMPVSYTVKRIQTFTRSVYL